MNSFQLTRKMFGLSLVAMVGCQGGSLGAAGAEGTGEGAIGNAAIKQTITVEPTDLSCFRWCPDIRTGAGVPWEGLGSFSFCDGTTNYEDKVVELEANTGNISKKIDGCYTEAIRSAIRRATGDYSSPNDQIQVPAADVTALKEKIKAEIKDKIDFNNYCTSSDPNVQQDPKTDVLSYCENTGLDNGHPALRISDPFVFESTLDTSNTTQRGQVVLNDDKWNFRYCPSLAEQIEFGISTGVCDVGYNSFFYKVNENAFNQLYQSSKPADDFKNLIRILHGTGSAFEGCASSNPANALMFSMLALKYACAKLPGASPNVTELVSLIAEKEKIVSTDPVAQLVEDRYKVYAARK